MSISGSSTVEPITSLVAELYAEQNPDTRVRVDGPGTTDGFVLFCDGETDISDASRPIAEEEVATCETNGVSYTELPVAFDGLTVVANNDVKIKCLSQADLYAIFGPESGGGTVQLSDASALADELGTNQTLPTSGSLEKFTPGVESGTYDSFIELGYEDIMDERLEAGSIPGDKVGTNDEGEPEVTEPLLSAGQFPNDNDIVKRVEQTDNGIGFLGFAYYQEAKGDLKAIAIENPDTGDCVKPTVKTVRNETYAPLSRPLFIYPSTTKVSESASVKGFLDFYMTKKNLNGTVEQAGYVPLSSSAVQESIDTWKAVG